MSGLGDSVADATWLASRNAQSVFRDAIKTPSDGSGWVRVMDALRKDRDWNDTQLGKAIGLSVSMVHQCRTNVRPLPAAARVRIVAALGVELTKSNLLSTLPRSVRDAISEVEAASATSRSSLLYSFFDQIDTEKVDAGRLKRFIVGLCVLAECSIAKLSSTLGMSEPGLRSVMEGEARLPFGAKVAIIEQFSISEVGALLRYQAEQLPSQPA